MHVVGQAINVKFNIRPYDVGGAGMAPAPPDGLLDVHSQNPNTGNGAYMPNGDNPDTGQVEFTNVQTLLPTVDDPGHWMGTVTYTQPGLRSLQLVRPESGANNDLYHIISTILINVVGHDDTIDVTCDYYNPTQGG